MKLKVEYEYFTCRGQGPDEYCYCDNKTETKEVSYITLERHDPATGKLLKQPHLLLHLE